LESSTALLTIKARILSWFGWFFCFWSTICLCLWLGAIFIIYTNPSWRLIKTKRYRRGGVCDARRSLWSQCVLPPTKVFASSVFLMFGVEFFRCVWMGSETPTLWVIQIFRVSSNILQEFIWNYKTNMSRAHRNEFSMQMGHN